VVDIKKTGKRKSRNITIRGKKLTKSSGIRKKT
jgi:hypothetical protein